MPRACCSLGAGPSGSKHTGRPECQDRRERSLGLCDTWEAFHVKNAQASVVLTGIRALLGAKRARPA
jgi:hypothetical protein